MEANKLAQRNYLLMSFIKSRGLLQEFAQAVSALYAQCNFCNTQNCQDCCQDCELGSCDVGHTISAIRAVKAYQY